MQRTLIAFALPIFGLLLAGCGGGAEGDAGQVETYETTGTITYNGKPLADAVVTFSPKESQPPAIGRTGTDGTYSLRTYEDGDGAAAGNYVVLVTKETVTATAGPPAHDPNSRSGAPPQAAHGRNAPESKSEIPTKYNSTATSDLEAVVKEDGENTFNFDLKD